MFFAACADTGAPPVAVGAEKVMDAAV